MDYVLWGDDGMPLALVEAKRTKRDAARGPAAGEAVCGLSGKAVRAAAHHLLLERLRALDVGRRELSAASGAGLLQEGRAGIADSAPQIAQATGGGEDQRGDCRALTTRRAPSGASAKPSRRDRDRKALVVMATGAGKTRTVIALCDLLMRCNWVEARAVPRRPRGAGESGGERLQEASARASPVNLVTEKDTEGRVFVSTYPTMMGLIDETQRRAAAVRCRAFRSHHHR